MNPEKSRVSAMLFIFAVFLFSSFFNCFLRLKFWPPTLLFTTFSLLTSILSLSPNIKYSPNDFVICRWVNRKDPEGKNIFGGGFLGLDNIGKHGMLNQINTVECLGCIWCFR